MRKALAILLALVMLVPLAGSALAADFGGERVQAPVQVTENAPAVAAEEENLDIFRGTAQSNGTNRVQHPTTATKDASIVYGSFSVRGGEDNQIVQHGLGEMEVNTGAFTMYRDGFTDSIYVSEYIDGVIYSVVKAAGRYGFARFDSIDDFKAGIYTVLAPAPEQVTGLCMDYTTNIMYAVGGSTWNLYMVDMQTYEFEIVTNLYGESAPGRPSITATPWMMSMDAQGNMYIIIYGGILYKIDKYTGEAERIGDTGLKPNYAQSLVYNYDNDKMYWFFYNSADSGTYTVDLKDATVTFVKNAVDCEVTGAFFINEKEIKTPTPVPSSKVEITQTEATLIGGESITLKAKALPLDQYVADRTITWTTSDANIATVDNGYVYAWSEGTAVITATNGSQKATCTVTVENPEKYYRDLSDAVNAANYGDENYVLFKYGVDNFSGADIDHGEFGVADVQGRGKVGKSGNAGLDNTDSYFENVFPLHLIGGSTVSFDYYVSSEQDGDYFRFCVDGSVVAYFSGVENEWKTYEWTVPKTGDYTLTWTFLKGTADADGEDMAMVDNIAINMKETEPLKGITVTPEEITLITRITYQLKVAYDPVNIADPSLTFTSSDPGVAFVNNDGLITARSEGDTTITATSNENPAISAQVTIHVAEPRTIETLDYKPAEIGKNYSFTLGSADSQYIEMNSVVKHAVGYYLDVKAGDAAEISTRPGASPAKDTVLYIYDENFNQVAFNNDDIGTFYSYLKFVPEHEGRYYIVVTTSNNYAADYGDVTLAIRAYDPVHVTGIEVTPSELEMNLGGFAQLQYKLLPTNTDYSAVTVVSSDESVVQINYDPAWDQYTLYGAALGEATVTITSVDGNFSGSSKVKVVEKTANPEYDGMVYAYNFSSTSYPAAFVKYDPNAPIDSSIEVVAPHIAAYYAGAYYDGMIYAYRYINLLNNHLVYYNRVDANTFTLQASTMVNIPVIPVDMAFDYTTGTMYAVIMNNDTGKNSLGTIDLQTGDITVIKNLASTIMNIAFTTDGTLYGIGTDGMLYQINKDTATLTSVANMGIATTYIGTMVYDNYEGLMYWFPFVTGASNVVAFDPETNDVEYIESVGQTPIELTCAMIWADPDTFPVSDEVPCEGVSIYPERTDLKLGETDKLVAKFTPENASDKRVIWTSENEAVVSVDRYGNITGNHEGSAYIVATTEDGGYTAKCLVTVDPVKSNIPEGMAKITLSVPEQVWSSGDGYQLLMDSSATTFDRSIIPMYLPRIAYSDAPEVYREFDCTVPENLDGTLDSKDIVVQGSMSIYVEPGTYDWVIVNPDTNDRCIYIANAGRSDNYQILPGYEYTFTVQRVISGGSVTDGTVVTRKFVGFEDTNTAKKYTVTFMGVGDEVLGTYVVRAGEDAIAPTVKTNSEGIPFVAWKGDYTKVNEDTVVYSVFAGDVNMDGKINAGDATLVLRDVVGNSKLNGEQSKPADANQNGSIDSGDATVILRYSVGYGWTA